MNCYNITNTIAQANVTVTGKKTWQNAEGTALPEKITVELFRDGESYATTETALDWTYSFGELPKYAVGNAVAEGEKADGHLYEYTVKEATALQEFTAYYDRTIDADGNVVINITNVKDVALIPISGTKSWFDNLPDQNHPQVTIVLYQEDAAGTVTAIDRATLSAQSWDYDFGYRPKYDENGNPYRYFVKEVDVPAGYVSVVSGYNVNNVLMALYEMGNISVTKNVVNSPETSNSFDFTLYVKVSKL